HRHTSAAINYYFHGTGRSTVGGEVLEWKAGDLMLSAPGWAGHNHASYEDFVYELTVQDQPLNIAMESLLWQESLKLPLAGLGVQEGFGTNRAARCSGGDGGFLPPLQFVARTQGLQWRSVARLPRRLARSADAMLRCRILANPEPSIRCGESAMIAIHIVTRACALALVALFPLTAALAQDQLKVAIGQINNWENQAPTLGQDAGIFKKHNLVLENVGTQGAGETMQPVISGSADLGAGVGVAGVLRAFARGAPVRILLPAFTGT